jgi:hypothetical protein
MSFGLKTWDAGGGLVSDLSANWVRVVHVQRFEAQQAFSYQLPGEWLAGDIVTPPYLAWFGSTGGGDARYAKHGINVILDDPYLAPRSVSITATGLVTLETGLAWGSSSLAWMYQTGGYIIITGQG